MIQWFHFLGAEQQKKMKKDTTDRARMMAAGERYEWYVQWLARMESWDCCCLLQKLIFILIVPRTPTYGRGKGEEELSARAFPMQAILSRSLSSCPDRENDRNKYPVPKMYVLFSRLLVSIFMYALCILPCELECHIPSYLIKPRTYISITPK